MANIVVTGATLQCSFGAAPSTLAVLPTNKVQACYVPAANIMDYVPMTNIMPFGMCNAPTNPAVIAATSAALGVPTPAPCVPATTAPWIVGAVTALLANQPTLNDSSTCMCTWLGVIKINMAGQTTNQCP